MKRVIHIILPGLMFILFSCSPQSNDPRKVYVGRYSGTTVVDGWGIYATMDTSFTDTIKVYYASQCDQCVKIDTVVYELTDLGAYNSLPGDSFNHVSLAFYATGLHYFKSFNTAGNVDGMSFTFDGPRYSDTP